MLSVADIKYNTHYKCSNIYIFYHVLHQTARYVITMIFNADVFIPSQGNPIEVGTITDPWVITATLHPVSGSQSGALLQGTTSALVVKGRATFGTLAISLHGIYMIDFRVSSPSLASGLVVTSQFVSVTRALLGARVIVQPSIVNTSKPFVVRLQILDSFTLQDAVDPTGSVSYQ